MYSALGLSYSSDLHSGIELRRTSHKAAEQKRRDSLKHCFDDLRQMIPNIVEKAPSKVFLLKKSFDYLCTLKSDIAQRELRTAEMNAQQEYFRSSLEAWMATLPESIPRPDLDGWKIPEGELKVKTRNLVETARIAAEIAEESAIAAEVASQGNQQGGNKEGKNGHGNKGGSKASAGKGSKSGNGKNSGNGNGNKTNNPNVISNDSNEDGDDSDDSEDDEVNGAKTISSSSSSPPSSTSSVRVEGARTLGAAKKDSGLYKDTSGDVHMSILGEGQQVVASKGSRQRARSQSTRSGQGEEEERDDEDIEEDSEEGEDDDEEDDDNEDEDEDDNDDNDYDDQEMADATGQR